MNEYNLELHATKDGKRIEQIVSKHLQIMDILNDDSKEAIKGGAAMYYEIKIKLEEKWS